MVLGLGLGTAIAVVAIVVSLFTGDDGFKPGACQRHGYYVASKIFGQEVALRQAHDALCDHLSKQNPGKPLVLSVHGPPGVGKSLFHIETARSLYSTAPGPDLKCPGNDCPGYKVLYGLDYTESQRESQHAALRNAIIEHMKSYSQALIVIEEYDKLDCTMRGFFRQIIQRGAVGNFTLANSIIILESNIGYTDLHSLLERARSREKISPELAQRTLKGIVFERWKSEHCEEWSDTEKMIGSIDFFLPFFPLERNHIRQLFEMKIRDRIAIELKAHKLILDKHLLTWNDEVLDFLVDKVDFDGGKYPIEGAKEVATIMSRYVSRPVRQWVGKNVEVIKAGEARNAEQRTRTIAGVLKVNGKKEGLVVVSWWR